MLLIGSGSPWRKWHVRTIWFVVEYLHQVFGSCFNPQAPGPGGKFRALLRCGFSSLDETPQLLHKPIHIA